MGILRESISANAQLPQQRLSELLVGGRYQLFSYADRDEVQGAALVYFGEVLPFAWLDYFAIRADLRGRGLGGELFREIVNVAKKHDLDWMLLEVDDDREGALQHKRLCARRIEFYRRLGAKLLQNVPYKFPSAFAEPLPMRLMAYQLGAGAVLSRNTLNQIVGEVFMSIHGRGDDDGLLRWFQRGVPERIEML
jgi:ribosomal protein S18 acetylase RimI-like enzyme